MGALRSVGLLVALGGLGGLLWWTSRDEPVVKVADARALLGGRSLLDADRFWFRRATGVLRLEFERGAGGEWRIEEPVRDLASAAVITALQQVLDRAQLLPGYRADEVTPRLLDECGLSDPRAELGVRFGEAAELRLAIGLEGPLGDDIFVRRTEPGADGRIDRVSLALLNALQVQPSEAREALVFRNDLTQVRHLRLERRLSGGGQDVLELERVGVSAWRIQEPSDLRTDDVAVTAFVGAILGLRAESFVAGDPGANDLVGPLAPDDASIEIDGGQGPESLTVRFDRASGAMLGHVLPREIWFSAETRQFDQVVALPLSELRARWLVTTSVEDAQAIRIVDGNAAVPLEIVRDGLGRFRLARPVDANMDPTATAELVQALHRAAALTFVKENVADLAPYGLGTRALRVELEPRARAREAMEIGIDHDTAETYAARAGEHQVVTIPREVAERLRRPWTDYVDRRLMSLESSGLIGAVRLERDDGSGEGVVRGEDGSFRRGTADGEKVDVDATLDALRELVAERSLPRDAIRDLPAVGRLKVLSPAGQTLGEFELWEDGEGRVLCALPRLPGVVFRLGSRDSRDLLALK